MSALFLYVVFMISEDPLSRISNRCKQLAVTGSLLLACTASEATQKTSVIQASTQHKTWNIINNTSRLPQALADLDVKELGKIAIEPATLMYISGEEPVEAGSWTYFPLLVEGEMSDEKTIENLIKKIFSSSMGDITAVSVFGDDIHNTLFNKRLKSIVGASISASVSEHDSIESYARRLEERASLAAELLRMVLQTHGIYIEKITFGKGEIREVPDEVESEILSKVTSLYRANTKEEVTMATLVKDFDNQSIMSLEVREALDAALKPQREITLTLSYKGETQIVTVGLPLFVIFGLLSSLVAFRRRRPRVRIQVESSK